MDDLIRGVTGIEDVEGVLTRRVRQQLHVCAGGFRGSRKPVDRRMDRRIVPAGARQESHKELPPAFPLAQRVRQQRRTARTLGIDANRMALWSFFAAIRHLGK